MHVESASTAGKESLVRPSTPGEDSPVESQRNQPDLSAMSMTGEDEIHLVFRERMEAQRIVQEQESEMLRASWEA